MTWNNMVSPHGIQQLAKAEMKRFHKWGYSSANTAIDKWGLKMVLLHYTSRSLRKNDVYIRDIIAQITEDLKGM